jgi:hypothetical protein
MGKQEGGTSMERNIFSVQFIEYKEAPVIKGINAPGSIVVTDSTALRSNTSTSTTTSTGTNTNTTTSTERQKTTTQTMTPGCWIHGDPPKPEAGLGTTIGPEIKKGIKTPILEETGKPMKGVEIDIVLSHRISAPEFDDPIDIPSPGGTPGGLHGIHDEDQDETSGYDSDNDDDDDDDQDSDSDSDSDQPPDTVTISFGELGMEPPFSKKE